MKNVLLCSTIWLLLGAGVIAQTEVSYTYDAAGRLLGVNYGGGQGISYVYDGRGNLLKRTVVSFVDADADFMDDAWETRFFGGGGRDGTGDFDKDGRSDVAEFVAGTDPTDAASRLAVSAVSTEGDGGEGFRVTWSSVAGKRYQLQSKDGLDGVAWTNVGAAVVATGESSSAVDRSVQGVGERYYRVVVGE